MNNIRSSASRQIAKLATMTALAIGLGACGGGGGGGGGGPNSTPPPPPPPPNFVNIFPNVTTDTEFAVLGLEAGATGTTASTLVSSGFAVRFDAAREAYVIDLPSEAPGRFESQTEDSRHWGGYLINDSDVVQEPWVTIFKPSPTNPDLALEHTTFGTFIDYDYYDYDEYPLGAFAFGSATPAGSVPTTGSAVFDAVVAGFTLDSPRAVHGTASLQFDFGAGTLAGSFNPYVISGTTEIALGPYGFVNTVFGVGSTTFSGQLQHGGTASLGAFNGLFTGPAAQELMARWTAPYQNPDSSEWSEMFGVWVGKRP